MNRLVTLARLASAAQSDRGAVLVVGGTRRRADASIVPAPVVEAEAEGLVEIVGARPRRVRCQLRRRQAPL